MEAPLPKPRVSAPTAAAGDELKRPVPLPRTRLPSAPAAAPAPTGPPPRASDILRSIGTMSKQISEDVAAKVTYSAKTANEKIEKSFMDSSRFAKDTLEKTISTSRAMRDSVTKSVIEGTRLRLRRGRKVGSDAGIEVDSRCVSLPSATVDVSLFDNIQFHSPLLEQKKYSNEEESNQNNEDFSSLHLNTCNLDDSSIFSSNSDSNTDTMSNFSYDSREFDHNTLSLISENEQMTYDTPKSSLANSISSSRSVPEVPVRRKKRESNLEMMRLNSMYENWTLPHQSSSDKVDETNTSRPSNSTIYEFDPLHSSTAPDRFVGISNELLLLESFLIGDSYGSIVSSDSQEEFSDELRESEYYNPPTPPERSDSLFPAELEPKSPTTSSKDRNSNWYISETDTEILSNSEDATKSSNSVKQRISSMLKLDSVLNKSVKQSGPQQKDLFECKRPPINSLPVPYFSGTLTRVQPGGAGSAVEELFKGSSSRYCVLANQKLMCYSDPTNSILKEAYPLENIVSVQVVLPLSSSTSGNSYWLELNMSGGGARRVVVGCASAAERRAWAQRLAQHLTAAFPAKHAAEYTRCGWCYLKEGVTGEWRGAWLMLVRRALLYSVPQPGDCAVDPAATLDLRKARCIALQEGDARREGSVLLVDGAASTLYLRWEGAGGARGEAAAWRSALRLAATNNGAALHHHQLTAKDVPVLVEKCMAFVCAHGALSEGIYRRAGGAAATSALLARLRRDSWAAALAPPAVSEHDAAAALKRFFRDLPEPLLPPRSHPALLAAMEITDENERVEALRRVVTGVGGAGGGALGGVVARNTARRLFAHLHFIASLAQHNKMTADNLAAVWAPTIMPAVAPATLMGGAGVGEAWGAREASVVRELITRWGAVWRATAAEESRDAAVRTALLRAAGPAPSPAPAHPRAPAGHLRVWLCLHNTENTIQIEVSPSKTAWDACVEAAAAEGGGGAGPHQLMVEEVVLSGALRRPLHPNEELLPAVLRWAYWDDADRKDNYLLVRENGPLASVAGAAGSAGGGAVSGPLRYAGPGARLFREHHFELAQGKLLCFKDKQGAAVVSEWAVRDFVWYWGYEPRRDPRARWALTFIPAAHRPPRSKQQPWFGHTVAGGTGAGSERLRWAAALWRALHPDSYELPAPPLLLV